ALMPSPGPGTAGPGTAAPAAYGPGYAAAPPPAGGLLNTGLAVAGGVAAGMLAERLLDGRGASSAGASAAGLFPGLDPGRLDGAPPDDGAQRALQDSPVDFGNGDDQWDTGVDPGGSIDTGGADGW
ncbi:MAG: hypothetical protein KGL50_10870, partial [Burkholderiales bacterium]|nr:hypothetical protein [Burkholderiales bacterium]